MHQLLAPLEIIIIIVQHHILDAVHTSQSSRSSFAKLSAINELSSPPALPNSPSHRHGKSQLCIAIDGGGVSEARPRLHF